MKGSGRMEAAVRRGLGLARAFGARAAVAAVVVGAAVLVAPVVALAAGDANQSTCPFETESSPGFRTYLPDCRAYELVTPPYKEGGLVLDEPAAIALDGERVIAGVPGVFAASGNNWLEGNRNPDYAVYEFARTAEGWRPTALTPPATQYPHGGIMAASTADELQTTRSEQEPGLRGLRIRSHSRRLAADGAHAARDAVSARWDHGGEHG